MTENTDSGWAPDIACGCPRCDQYYGLDHENEAELDHFWSNPQEWEEAHIDSIEPAQEEES